MEALNLQINEEIIYQANVYFSEEEKSEKEYELYLTNFNLIFYKKTKKLFSEPKIELIKMPFERFNLVDGEPLYSVFQNDDYFGIRTIYERKIIEISFYNDDEKNYYNECNILGRLLSSEISRAKNKSKTCLKCGAQVEPGMSFCKDCGNKI